MHTQFFSLSPLMGEASVMGVCLQDRMVSQMLRPYKRSHVRYVIIHTSTTLSLPAIVLVFGGVAISLKEIGRKTEYYFAMPSFLEKLSSY